MMGADIVYYEVSSNQVTDAFALDFVAPIPDFKQDWTLTSASNLNRVLTVEAFRLLDTMDPQDTKITNDSWPAIDGTKVIAAWGDSAYIEYHGAANRVTGEVRFFSPPPADPLAAIKADPTVKSFEVVQLNFSIPASPTTYAYRCAPLGSAWGGPIPWDGDLSNVPYYHLVALEYVPDPARPGNQPTFDQITIVVIFSQKLQSFSLPGNQPYVHHLTVSCYGSDGSGPGGDDVTSLAGGSDPTSVGTQ